MKIISSPGCVENIAQLSNSNVDSLISGTSFLPPSASSNSNFTFDLIGNELLTSISNPSLVASAAGNQSDQSSSSSRIVTFSVPQSQLDTQKRLSNTESFFSQPQLQVTHPLTSQNSVRFELELSQFLMLFSTMFDVYVAPRLILTDIRFCSSTQVKKKKS